MVHDNIPVRRSTRREATTTTMPSTLRSRSLRTLAYTSLITLLLAACGGDAPPQPDIPPPPPGIPVPESPAASPYGQDGSTYSLVFADEFDAPLDSGKWNDAIWYEAANPTQNYAVEEGKLKIWPQRDDAGNFFNRTIDTDGKYYQTYGYFEIEAKLPRGKGVWPAFWLLNHDDPTLRPEIDVLEAYPGGGPDSGWSDNDLHPTAYATTVWPLGSEHGTAGSQTHQYGGDLSAGFHKYAVKWEPGKQTFYFDGAPVHTVAASMSSRMYLLLDLWFGSASGTPDHTTPTGKDNAFEINYVRAWQAK